jgi:hypothetical protein
LLLGLWFRRKNTYKDAATALSLSSLLPQGEKGKDFHPLGYAG